MGRFKPEDVEKLLVACHRCCCICHRFCGVKIQIDHMIPQADDGPDTYDNALPVCLECHAEIHTYNPQHPIGRKFQPSELRGHRDQWLSICENRPEIFHSGSLTRAEVGPLQALIDELEFNEAVTSVSPGQDQFCLFKEQQFLEAVRTGSISTLRNELKRSVNLAYVHVGQVNQLLSAMANNHNPGILGELYQMAFKKIGEAKRPIVTARDELLKFLGSEN